MNTVVTSALPVFALILLGFLCGRQRVLGRHATDSLNLFVVWLALPALLFQAMAQASWTDLYQPGFMAAFGGGVLITFGVSLLLGRDKRLADAAIEGLDAAYANAAYMGIPIALAVLGPAGLAPAILASLLTVCALFGIALAMIEFDLQQAPGWHQTLVKVLRALARNPLLVSPVAGMAWNMAHLPYPTALRTITTMLGGAASPCALVTIGLFLTQTRGGSGLRVVLRLVALKLLFQPAITALLAFTVFPLPPLWAHAALLLSALPIGTGPFMLAKLYRREAGITSRAILVSTLLSVITVSVLIAWLGA